MQTLRKETVQALSLLYGNTAACAASRNMTMLWSSGSRAEELFRVLLSQLPGTGSPAQPLFPQDRTMLLSGVYPAVVCRVQCIEDPETPLLLFQFSEMQERCTSELPEFRALMRQHIDLTDRAVFDILRALSETEHARGAAREAAALKIRRACWALLHQQFCEEELLWYDLANGDASARQVTVSVTDVLKQFLAGIQEQTGGLFSADAVKIADNLAAYADPNRLLFVLLSLFAGTQKGNPARTHFSLTAARDGDRICISLSFSADGDTDDAECFRQYEETDGSVLNEQNLQQNFCRLFDAEITQVQTDGTAGFLLTLRAGDRMPPAVSFHAVPKGSDSKFAVMLSRVLNNPSAS